MVADKQLASGLLIRTWKGHMMFRYRLRSGIGISVLVLTLIGSVVAAYAAAQNDSSVSEYQADKLRDGLTFTEMHEAMQAYLACVREQPIVDEASLLYSEHDGWFSHVIRSAEGRATNAVEGAAGQACRKEYISEVEHVYADEHAKNAAVLQQLHERLARCLQRDDFTEAYSENADIFVRCYAAAVER